MSHIRTERYTKQQFVRLFQDLVTIIENRFVSLFDIIRKLYKQTAFATTRQFTLYLQGSCPSLSYFKAVTICLLHFALKILFILRQKVFTFRVKKLFHFASKVVTFRVNVTFRVKSCYISR